MIVVVIGVAGAGTTSTSDINAGNLVSSFFLFGRQVYVGRGTLDAAGMGVFGRG